MIHRHDFPPAPGLGHNGGGCRLCESEDREALVEHTGERLWESRRHGTLDDVAWADAGDYWQRIFRELADTAIRALEGHRSR